MSNPQIAKAIDCGGGWTLTEVEYVDGTYEPELPALMPRTDGANLLNPGRVHSFHGERIQFDMSGTIF